MVSDNILLDTESSDYLIKNEKGSIYAIIVKYWHSFDPLGEVVYCYDDVTMPPRRIWVKCSEINSSLDEGATKMNINIGAGCARIF